MQVWIVTYNTIEANDILHVCLNEELAAKLQKEEESKLTNRWQSIFIDAFDVREE